MDGHREQVAAGGLQKLVPLGQRRFRLVAVAARRHVLGLPLTGLGQVDLELGPVHRVQLNGHQHRLACPLERVEAGGRAGERAEHGQHRAHDHGQDRGDAERQERAGPARVAALLEAGDGGGAVLTVDPQGPPLSGRRQDRGAQPADERAQARHGLEQRLRVLRRRQGGRRLGRVGALDHLVNGAVEGAQVWAPADSGAAVQLPQRRDQPGPQAGRLRVERRREVVYVDLAQDAQRDDLVVEVAEPGERSASPFAGRPVPGGGRSRQAQQPDVEGGAVPGEPGQAVQRLQQDRPRELLRRRRFAGQRQAHAVQRVQAAVAEGREGVTLEPLRA